MISGQVKVLVAQANDLAFVLRPHKVERRKQISASIL